MSVPVFHNRAAELRANIVAAQCQDLALGQIERHANGEVSASLRGQRFRFRWDWINQALAVVK